MTSRSTGAIVAMLIVLGGAGRAAGQDVRVEVKVALPPEVIREVRRIVAKDILASVRELDQVARDVLTHLPAFRRLGWASGQSRTLKFEEVATETRTLALGANGALELKNISGSISVTAGSGRDTRVQIVRRSHGRTEADAKLGLERVRVAVDQRGERATVQSRYLPDRTDRGPAYSVDTSYDVTAPPGTRVSVDTISGDIIVKGIHGELSLGAASGDITVTDGGRIGFAKTLSGDVTVTGVETDGTVDLGTVSGTVLAQQIKCRRFTGSAISGNATGRDVQCDSVQLTSMVDDVEYSGPLVKNGRYEFQTHSGSVRFFPTGNVGFEIQANTFSGNVRNDLSVQIRDAGRTRLPRGTVRGTFGDGSATVTLTAFSGNIVIGKK